MKISEETVELLRAYAQLDPDSVWVVVRYPDGSSLSGASVGVFNFESQIPLGAVFGICAKWVSEVGVCLAPFEDLARWAGARYCGILPLRDNDTLLALAGERRHCFPKERHASKGAAEAAARSLLKRALAKNPGRIHAYRCEHCGSWHTGH